MMKTKIAPHAIRCTRADGCCSGPGHDRLRLNRRRQQRQGGTDQKTITIATSNDAPFSFTDQASGELKGIDGDMINAIAEAKGWKVKVFTSEFATLR